MLDLPNADELLGVRIQGLMRSHLKVCSACEESYERRGHPAAKAHQGRMHALA